MTDAAPQPLPPLDTTPWNGAAWSSSRVNALVWGFILLGIAGRAARYFLKFPLWDDECFLMINLIDVGYIEALEPLEYHQVASVLFLWTELTIIKLFGFGEFSVRLFPFLCSITSLFVFRHFAGMLVRGAALVFAVGIFSTSYMLLRYASEAKPYSSDLLVSLIVTSLTVAWIREPTRTRPLWILTAFVPIAIGMSFTAVFVVAGALATILFVIWRSQSTGAWRPFFAVAVAFTASFGALWALVIRTQNVELGFMREYWPETFPPIAEPLRLFGWLVWAHTGELLPYPIGGKNGGSTASFLLVVVAAVVLRRSRRGVFLLLFLSPLLPNLFAAALQRFPYSAPTRCVLYMAPVFCVLVGLGAASALDWLTRRMPRAQFIRSGFCVVMVMLVVVSVARDVWRPSKYPWILRSRAFAQWFWTNSELEGEVVCTRTDLGLSFSPEADAKQTALVNYLVYQKIYSPRHAARQPAQLDAVSTDHPVRYVHFRLMDLEHDDTAYAQWLAKIKSRYKLVGRESFDFPRFYDKEETKPRDHNRVEVFKFVPLAGG